MKKAQSVRIIITDGTHRMDNSVGIDSTDNTHSTQSMESTESMEKIETKDRHCVVINSQEQYSIWSCSKGLPNGWIALDMQGSKQDCLAYIDSVWKDIRPKDTRRLTSDG